jgi:hypothetical protein
MPNIIRAESIRPDGLTNTALRTNAPEAQGFSVKADRQTFQGGGAGWDDVAIGDGTARLEFCAIGICNVDG